MFYMLVSITSARKKSEKEMVFFPTLIKRANNLIKLHCATIIGLIIIYN